MTVKAVSDIGTLLTHAAITGDVIPETGFKKLVGIRSTPAKGEAPEQLDATEMHDEVNVGIAGRKSIPSLEYEFNLTKANQEVLLPLEGKRGAFLEVMPEGDGYLVVGSMSFWDNGSSLNSVKQGTINIIAEDIKYIKDATTYVA